MLFTFFSSAVICLIIFHRNSFGMENNSISNIDDSVIAKILLQSLPFNGALQNYKRDLEDLKKIACLNKKFYSVFKIFIVPFYSSLLDKLCNLQDPKFLNFVTQLLPESKIKRVLNMHHPKEMLCPLHYAVTFNRSQVVSNLLKCGADPNCYDGKSNTPLHYAAKLGNLEIICLLLNHKNIKVNVKNEDGETPLDLAENEEVKAFLVRNGAFFGGITEWDQKLVDALYKNNLSDVKMCLDNGANVNYGHCCKPQYYQTCLHFAANEGCLEIAKMLIDRGANVNAMTDCSYTPLQFACSGHNLKIEIVDLLLNANAEVNALPEDERTALERAVFYRQIEIVKLLIEHGAYLNTITFGRTPLAEAFDQKVIGHPDIYNLLKANGGKLRVYKRFAT